MCYSGGAPVIPSLKLGANLFAGSGRPALLGGRAIPGCTRVMGASQKAPGVRIVTALLAPPHVGLFVAQREIDQPGQDAVDQCAEHRRPEIGDEEAFDQT